jgi:hypothetical protein
LSSLTDDDEPDELPDPWYARIVYLFEDEHSIPMAHFPWFVLHIHGSETKLGKVFVYIYMGAGSKTVMKELAGLHERFLLRLRLQKQSDHQTAYIINRIDYSKLRNYSLSPDF